MSSVGIIGSGNWGTAIAKIVGANILRFKSAKYAFDFEETVRMYVYEEIVNGKKLSAIINEKHENVKYLPGYKLSKNVVAVPDLETVGKYSDILIIVLPHQFLEAQCTALKECIKSTAIAVSLCKGFHSENNSTHLISSFITSILRIPCYVLMGASIANEVAAEQFCESTLGVSDPHNAHMLKQLFQTDYFRIGISPYVEVVELCGTLKNVVALASGFCDGLGLGNNTKAAIIRLGFLEMMAFADLFFPIHDKQVFYESCGIADLVATCYGGRNRRIAAEFVKTGKSFEELEKDLLNGQKLQGPSTAKDMMIMLKNKNATEKFPLLVTVYEICHESKPVHTLLDACMKH